jgi:dGTP triphosphohydrolase
MKSIYLSLKHNPTLLTLQHELGTTLIIKTPRRHKRLRIEQDDTRLGFEVDYDRIIFSAAFRSLQDKTQVIPLSKTDFVHQTDAQFRVSVVGRSLGRLVGKKIIEKYPFEKSARFSYE